MRLGDPERHQEGGRVKTKAEDAWGPQGLEKAGRSLPCRHLGPQSCLEPAAAAGCPAWSGSREGRGR